MTVGPTSGDRSATHAAFGLLRSLADAAGLEGCSMGMSGDLDIALEHGATHVRIGSAWLVRRASPTWRSDQLVSGQEGFWMSIMKRAMDFLGLGPDDAYDDYDMPLEPERPQRSSRAPREPEPVPRSSRGGYPEQDDELVRTTPARRELSVARRAIPSHRDVPSSPTTIRRYSRGPRTPGHRLPLCAHCPPGRASRPRSSPADSTKRRRSPTASKKGFR